MLPILLTELVDGKKPEYGEEEHHVLKADPPEEIAAWDVWVEELKTVRELLLDVWNAPQKPLRAEPITQGHGRPMTCTARHQLAWRNPCRISTLTNQESSRHRPWSTNRACCRTGSSSATWATSTSSTPRSWSPARSPGITRAITSPSGVMRRRAEESDAEALRKAWARFEERARRSLRMEPPPAKRLAEVADIAETIINALLPEDEDDRREFIDDDYQLESDIETFEELTGKVIQPEDDEPILGDEIELEDIERSL